jgi:hypothetical protein
MDFNQFLIITTVPAEAVERVMNAVAAAGGGVIGQYTHCAFTHSGIGHFKPSEAANPHVGEKTTLNAVDEVRIETFCGRENGKAVVAAIRAAHPYEEPVIHVLPLLSPDNL